MTLEQSIGRPPTLYVSQTLPTTARTQIIAAPTNTGQRIVIVFLQVQNEGSSAASIYLSVGNDASKRFHRVLAQNQGDGAGYPISVEFRLPSNVGLWAEASVGANACGVTVWYYIENAG